jgi:large-conductance mechanosensitive channel
MAITAWFIASLTSWDVRGHITEKVLYMAAAIVIGAAVFALVTSLLGSTELKAITTPFIGRFKGGKDR